MQEHSATAYIIDSDPGARREWQRLLHSAGCETREVSSLEDLRPSHGRIRPACVVLGFDPSAPGAGSQRIASALSASGRLSTIILPSGRACVVFSLAALHAGAVRFRMSPSGESALLDAVQATLAVDLECRRAQLMSSLLGERLATLTRREHEVLEHVLRGRLNKQIAADLGLQEKTVKVHRGRVMRKMGARSVAELVQLAGAAGMVNRALDGLDWRKRFLEHIAGPSAEPAEHSRSPDRLTPHSAGRRRRVRAHA